jgi:rhodanese-related sulfurtransferase
MRVDMPRMAARRAAVALLASAWAVAALLVPAGRAHAQACPATEATAATAVIASADLPPEKRTRAGFYLTAAAAHPMIAAQPDRVLFLDVRTRAEVAFVGMPQLVDANVPFLFLPDDAGWDAAKNAFRMTPNPDFVAEVGRRLAAKGLSKDDPVVLICQGGLRAARAADALGAAGYTLVFSIVDGFEGDVAPDGPTRGQRTVNGWKNAGLPWSYALAREKMYLPN